MAGCRSTEGGQFGWREAPQPVFVSSGLNLSPSPAAMVSPGQEAVSFLMPTDPGRGSALKQHGVPRKGGCPLCDDPESPTDLDSPPVDLNLG